MIQSVDNDLLRSGVRNGQSCILRRRSLALEIKSGYLALASLHRSLADACPDADSTTHQLMYADAIVRISESMNEELARIEQRGR